MSTRPRARYFVWESASVGDRRPELTVQARMMLATNEIPPTDRLQFISEFRHFVGLTHVSRRDGESWSVASAAQGA